MFWVEYPRDVVQIAGVDASSYLHSQASCDVQSMAVGASAWTFLLQPTGKIDVLARVWRTADDCYVLDTDAGFGAVMVARLNRFKIRVKAELTDLQWNCLAVRGDGAAAVAGVASWGGGVDLLGTAVVAPTTAAAATPADLLAARINARWPAMGSEIVPGETIPAETGITSLAVSFTKGCYPGQELVERMDSRGATPPRSLQRVTVPDGTSAGDAYLVDGRVVGVVTSVWRDHALAMVKRGAA